MREGLALELVTLVKINVLELRSNMKKKIVRLCQAVHAGFVAPKKEYVQYLMLVLGLGLVTFGFASGAFASDIPQANYDRLDNVIKIVLDLIEGRFGILVMLCAGIGAIISSAFGQYRAALSLLVVALGAFILRTIITIFFNTQGIDSLQN